MKINLLTVLMCLLCSTLSPKVFSGEATVSQYPICSKPIDPERVNARFLTVLRAECKKIPTELLASLLQMPERSFRTINVELSRLEVVESQATFSITVAGKANEENLVKLVAEKFSHYIELRLDGLSPKEASSKARQGSSPLK